MSGIGASFRQQSLDFRPRRRAAGAADARAFEAGGGGAEPQRLRLVLPLGQSQREPAVQGVTSAERVDGANLKYRDAPDHAAVEINDVVRSIADGEERRRGWPGRSPLIASARVGLPAQRRRQTLGGKNDMRGDAKQRIVLDCRAEPASSTTCAEFSAPRRLRRSGFARIAADSQLSASTISATPGSNSSSRGVTCGDPLVPISDPMMAIAARVDEASPTARSTALVDFQLAGGGVGPARAPAPP